jgi:hypothetical protein
MFCRDGNPVKPNKMVSFAAQNALQGWKFHDFSGFIPSPAVQRFAAKGLD